MRVLVAVSVVVLGLAGVGAWVYKAQPDWYLRARYPLEYQDIIRAHARNYDLDPDLLAAVVYVESRFRPDARSDAGAIGLMQLLPDTAQGIATRTGGTKFVLSDLQDPEINIRYGAWYLDHLRDRYGDMRTALAAYHAGQGNVDRWQREGSASSSPKRAPMSRRSSASARVYERAYGPTLGS